MRRHAKAINFGLIYGMSPFGLTRSTELTLAEAENFVKAYFQQFPGIKKYLDGIRKEAAQKGYVETLLGRRRYFPALQSKINGAMKNREEREAINAPIQGTAADIMKIAMLHIPPALREAGLHGRMLLQVHDELVLEVPREELDRTAKVVQEVMASAYPLDIPPPHRGPFGRQLGRNDRTGLITDAGEAFLRAIPETRTCSFHEPAPKDRRFLYNLILVCAIGAKNKLSFSHAEPGRRVSASHERGPLGGLGSGLAESRCGLSAGSSGIPRPAACSQ